MMLMSLIFHISKIIHQNANIKNDNMTNYFNTNFLSSRC